MLHFLAENWGTLVVGLAVLGIVAAIVRGQIKSRKKGGSSCGCGCAGCAMSGSCHPEQ